MNQVVNPATKVVATQMINTVSTFASQVNWYETWDAGIDMLAKRIAKYIYEYEKEERKNNGN